MTVGEKSTDPGEASPKAGNILEGPFWPERVKVISCKQIGTGIEIQGIV